MSEITEPIGKRIGRFIFFLGIIFAVSAGFIITQRLSKDSLALLLGLTCGVAAMLPTVVLIFLWMRHDLNRRKGEQSAPSSLGQPQVIVVAPPALSDYYSGYHNPISTSVKPQWNTAKQEREFTIVGGTD
jgi:hypothetical protein